jgi:uncharacterized protein YegP (UPF0339 family)
MISIDYAKIERCKQKLLQGYFDASIVESTLRTKDFSQELHYGLDFLKFGTWLYLPKEWFTDPANYPDFAFSEFGRGIARGEEKYIIDQTIDCKKTAIEHIDQFTIDSLLKAAAELVSPRDKSETLTLFLPIAYYTSVFIEWGLKGEVQIEKNHLYAGPFKFRLFWSNKFMDFDKIVVVTTPFAEWVAKPSVRNRLEVSLIESREKIDQMELRAETKFNFRIENAEQIRVLSAPLPSKPDIASETKRLSAGSVDGIDKWMHLPEPKFELFKDKAGKFRFRLLAANGEIIAVSEAYSSKDACVNGIESVKKNAPIAKTAEAKE